jgi:hypothetical protein
MQFRTIGLLLLGAMALPVAGTAQTTCVCRKLDSAILMVKAAKDRP